MNDITVSLDNLAGLIKDAIVRRERSRDEWVQATIDLCTRAAEAKERFPSLIAFGEWWDKQGFGLNKDDRAAAIAMGREIEEAKKVLTTTQRSSLRLIYADEFPKRSLTAEKTTRVETTTQVQPKIVTPVQEPVKLPQDKPSVEYEQAVREFQRRYFAGEPYSVDLVTEEIGCSSTPVRKAHGTFLEWKKHEETYNDDVPLTDRQKAEINRRVFRGDIEFENKVRAEVKRRTEAISLPYYFEQIEKIKGTLSSSFGHPSILTKQEFNLLLKVAHPDRTPTADERNEAIRILNSIKIKVVKEEAQSIFDQLPKTLAELDAMRVKKPKK